MTHRSGFISHMYERFPDRFLEMCEWLKKLCDITNSPNEIPKQNLMSITQFILDDPDGWEYLHKAGNIFKEGTPCVFRECMWFIKKLSSRYPEKFESILWDVTHRFDRIQCENRLYLLTKLLWFLMPFLDQWEAEFYEAMGKLEDIIRDDLEAPENTGDTFVRDGLDFLTLYVSWLPEKWEEMWKKIAGVISRNRNIKDQDNVSFLRHLIQGFSQYLDSTILHQDPEILHDFFDFIEKVARDKDSTKLIQQMNLTIRKRPGFWQKYENTLSYAFVYLMRHKKKKIMPFVKLLHHIDDLSLWVNLDVIFVGWAGLPYRSEETLTEIFSWENVESTKIWQYFVKIWWEWSGKSEELRSQIHSIMPKPWKRVDKKKILPVLIKIHNTVAEHVFVYFEKLIQKKIVTKFKREFWLDNNFDGNLISGELLEVYKMYKNTRTNKTQAHGLIKKYLEWTCYSGNGDIQESYPYNHPYNRKFLTDWWQWSAISSWLGRNEREYEVPWKNTETEWMWIERKVGHHVKVAHDKMQLLAVDEVFETPWKLLEYFDDTIKKGAKRYDQTIFRDLEFQISEIKKLLKSTKARKIKKIRIYHELDPLKIAMMGNWVDGSCLSFYSSIWNYWSAITNALEVNKGVFYIEDEECKIIGRVLVGIDSQNMKFEIHPTYTKWNIEIDISQYFRMYISELAENMWLNWIDGDRENVELLFCDGWYSGD